ncbi:MAG: DUF2809 domain-containing protein [Cetobacterium sp.]
MKKNKLSNCIVFISIFIIELYIGVYVRDRYVRPYLGDILVIPLIYSFLNIFIKNNYKKLIFQVVIFAIFIEILQYFKLVQLLGIKNRILRIVIGTTYDMSDIFCYMLGGVLTYLIMLIIKRREKEWQK